MCGVDSEDITIKCHSFLQIYVKSAYFGRKKKLDKKAMCSGEKGRKSDFQNMIL